MSPLIPEELLQKSNKILFITHLAIGDFVYMQNYFKEFATKYPHLKVDIWVDEQRGKILWRRWKTKSDYILYDWLKTCSFINKIYKDTSSWWQLKKFFKEVKKENYPIVVSLAGLKKHRYARYARKISPKGFIAGIVDPLKKYQFFKKYRFNKFNLKVKNKVFSNQSQNHITNQYAFWFENFFDLNVEKESRAPFLDVPKEWISYGKLKFLKWNLNRGNRNQQKVVFINAFAKTKKRCWPMNKVIKLIDELRQCDAFYSASFVVNVLPQDYKKFENLLKNLAAQKIFLFTAHRNFFQLPAIVSLCDLVISVETSVMHIAVALKIPLVALMRQKNPEWMPYGVDEKNIVFTKRRKDKVKDISVEDVVEQGIRS